MIDSINSQKIISTCLSNKPKLNIQDVIINVIKKLNLFH